MTDELVAEAIVKSVLKLRQSGIKDEKEIIAALMKDFTGTEDHFRFALEMISTGALRAGIMSSGKSYPKGNLNIEDNPILKTAFKMHWIELKGEKHYQDNYERTNRKWWKFWS